MLKSRSRGAAAPNRCRHVIEGKSGCAGNRIRLGDCVIAKSRAADYHSRSKRKTILSWPFGGSRAAKDAEKSAAFVAPPTVRVRASRLGAFALPFGIGSAAPTFSMFGQQARRKLRLPRRGIAGRSRLLEETTQAANEAQRPTPLNGRATPGG